LYEYAEANCLLSTSQAGFRKQKDTIHQLQNIILALEDAKLFKQDMYAYTYIILGSLTSHLR